MSKKKTLDQKAAEKHGNKIDPNFDGTYEEAFLDGVRYGRRSAIEELKKYIVDSIEGNAASDLETLEEAICRIRARAKR